MSRADTSCYAEQIRTERDQPVSKAPQSLMMNSAAMRRSTAVRCSEAVIKEVISQFTYEFNPAKSSMAVTWETQVTETTDEQCVFENQPGHSALHTLHRVVMTRSTRLLTQRMRTEVLHVACGNTSPLYNEMQVEQNSLSVSRASGGRSSSSSCPEDRGDSQMQYQ